MCVIAAKPIGIEMPADNEIMNMWFRNPDGAGIMYAHNGKVHIEKGFMEYDDFCDKLEELNRKYDLKNMAVVMHFRITTHGGTKPGNCHPFPISDSVGMLSKLKLNTDIGVAHNGIIDIKPRKGISDTMEYIAGQLAPLYKAVPQFYKNKHLMQMVEYAIDSKMAFLTKEGNIYTIGKFMEHNGMKYSNESYQNAATFRDYCFSNWEGGGWQDSEIPTNAAEIAMMWVDETEGEYVVDDEGNMIIVGDFAIDTLGIVYEYDYEQDAMIPLYNYTAFNSNNMVLKYNPNSDLTTVELAYF